MQTGDLEIHEVRIQLGAGKQFGAGVRGSATATHDAKAQHVFRCGSVPEPGNQTGDQ